MFLYPLRSYVGVREEMHLHKPSSDTTSNTLIAAHPPLLAIIAPLSSGSLPENARACNRLAHTPHIGEHQRIDNQPILNAALASGRVRSATVRRLMQSNTMPLDLEEQQPLGFHKHCVPLVSHELPLLPLPIPEEPH